MMPTSFTPFAGLMAVAERITRAVEVRVGVQIWDGDEGLGSVVNQKLRELKVPVRPIRLDSQAAPLTPRALAEKSGFIQKKRARRAVR